MGKEWVVIAKTHTQPPFETPAVCETATKCFKAGTTIEAVWEWVAGMTSSSTIVTSVEITEAE
jgi:hypothetical protein